MMHVIVKTYTFTITLISDFNFASALVVYVEQFIHFIYLNTEGGDCLLHRRHNKANCLDTFQDIVVLRDR